MFSQYNRIILGTIDVETMGWHKALHTTQECLGKSSAFSIRKNQQAQRLVVHKNFIKMKEFG